MVLVWLCLASAIGWFISALAGGGSSLILIPILGWVLGTAAIPPVLTLGCVFGNAERTWVYRQQIHWPILRWELPGALVGSILGVFALKQISLEWLTLLMAGFLLTSGISYLVKPDQQSFQVRVWYFLPAGFVFAFLSGMIGGTGPLLGPFYLNYGLRKEELLATQASTRVVIHIVKTIAYAAFGLLTPTYLGYGLLIGLASIPGNALGHWVLTKISDRRFRQLMTFFILLSGLLLLWQERTLWFRLSRE